MNWNRLETLLVSLTWGLLAGAVIMLAMTYFVVLPLIRRSHEKYMKKLKGESEEYIKELKKRSEK